MFKAEFRRHIDPTETGGKLSHAYIAANTVLTRSENGCSCSSFQRRSLQNDSYQLLQQIICNCYQTDGKAAGVPGFAKRSMIRAGITTLCTDPWDVEIHVHQLLVELSKTEVSISSSLGGNKIQWESHSASTKSVMIPTSSRVPRWTQAVMSNCNIQVSGSSN